MAAFIKVASVGEIKPGNGKLLRIQGNSIALFNVDGSFYAVEDTCTHKGGPLSDGVLQGREVTCPWHGAVFDVTTGAVVQGPATASVASYPVRVNGSDVEIELAAGRTPDHVAG